MIVTSISLTRTLQIDSYNWIKCGLQAEMEEKDTPEQSIKELESIVDGYFNEKIKAAEPVKQVKPELDTDLVKQRDLLIQDLNEAIELKQLTIIHNEAPIEIKSDAKFLDAVLSNKLRLNSKK